jgi:hypothetical protein
MKCGERERGRGQREEVVGRKSGSCDGLRRCVSMASASNGWCMKE